MDTDEWSPLLKWIITAEIKFVLQQMHENILNFLHQDVLKSGRIDTEWLLVCDLEEFLYASYGFYSLFQYLSQLDRETSFIMLPWKNFGYSGHIEHPPKFTQYFMNRAHIPFSEPESGACRGKCICRVSVTRKIDIHHPHAKKDRDYRYKLSSGKDKTDFKAQTYRGINPIQNKT